jgi:hypothetical protein
LRIIYNLSIVIFPHEKRRLTQKLSEKAFETIDGGLGHGVRTLRAVPQLRPHEMKPRNSLVHQCSGPSMMVIMFGIDRNVLLEIFA